MKSRLFALGILLFFTACSSRKYVKNNKKVEKVAKKNNPDPVVYSTLSYIESFKNVAVAEMNANGVPASIILAQGILESGSGNSDLARYANNHFGIKCTAEWKGNAYYKDDDEKNDCFRVYKNAAESYKDHSAFLKRKRYAFLFELDKNDYKNWAIGLKKAGYATNPKYPDLLINIIEKYGLNIYDQPESQREKIVREDRVFTEINANIPKEEKKFTPVEVPAGGVAKVIPPDGIYVIVSGDTLYSLSKRFNITIEELKKINNLQSDNLTVGQKLTVVK